MRTFYKLQPVFIESMMRAIYDPNIFLEKNTLNVPTVNLFSYFFFQCFRGF